MHRPCGISLNLRTLSISNLDWPNVRLRNEKVWSEGKSVRAIGCGGLWDLPEHYLRNPLRLMYNGATINTTKPRRSKKFNALGYRDGRCRYGVGSLVYVYLTLWMRLHVEAIRKLQFLWMMEAECAHRSLRADEMKQ